jgi:hypothetical protein
MTDHASKEQLISKVVGSIEAGSYFDVVVKKKFADGRT